MSSGSVYATQQLIHSDHAVLFALVDGLQYERYFGDELVHQPEQSIPLFDNYPDSKIAFAGPWIIRINQTSENRDKLCELESIFPSVSWLVTCSGQRELVAHLQKNMNIMLHDGRTAFLRLQDPRVQFRLGTILDEQQHRDLTQPILEWVTTIEGKCWSLKQKEFVC